MQRSTVGAQNTAQNKYHVTEFFELSHGQILINKQLTDCNHEKFYKIHDEDSTVTHNLI